jgi:hypothetical protein
LFFFCFFFFLNAIPVFCHTAFYGTFSVGGFFLFPIPFCLSSPSFRWCDGAPGHFPRPPTPIPPHIHRHTQHLYTHGRLFPTGHEPRADLAVVAERVLILLSTTLPSAPTRHTHTSMARRSFLPSKKSSPFGGIRTRAGTATSEHCLRQPCGHRATLEFVYFG